MKTSNGNAAGNKVVKLGIAAKGSYAFGYPYCTKYDHVRCGWDGVRF